MIPDKLALPYLFDSINILDESSCACHIRTFSSYREPGESFPTIDLVSRESGEGLCKKHDKLSYESIILHDLEDISFHTGMSNLSK